MKKFLFDISIVRAILVVCIVIGHSFVIYSNGSTWPLPDGVPPLDALKWINPIFISFQLQAFVMISGYLFACQQESYCQSLGAFVLKKAKRILLPCLLFGTLYYFVILYSGEIQPPLQLISTLCKGAGHLWFLPMLFCCYVVGKIADDWLGQYNWLYNWPILVFLSCVSMGAVIVPGFWCIPNAVFYYVFFHFGEILYKNRLKIISRLCKIKVLCVLWIITITMIYAYAYGIVSKDLHWAILRILRIALGLIGSISLWLTVNYFTQKIDIENHKFLRYILLWNGWYGVYIIHQFVLKYAYYKTSVPLWLGEWLPWVSVVSVLILSCVVTIMLLKTRVGRYLIG